MFANALKMPISRGLIAFTAAASIHGFALGYLFISEPPTLSKNSQRPKVRLKLVSRKPAQKQTAAKASQEPKKAKPVVKKRAKRKIVKKPKLNPQKKARVQAEPKIASKQPQKKQAKAKNSEKAKSKAKKLRRFSVAMTATVPGGNVAVPVDKQGAGWVFGRADGTKDGARELAPENYTPREDRPKKISEVSSLPKLLKQPSYTEMKAFYPGDARKNGIEANVSLKILVNAEGVVTQVRIIRKAGKGFDEAARKLVKRFQFKPGVQQGKPVAVWIPWNYKFRLNG